MIIEEEQAWAVAKQLYGSRFPILERYAEILASEGIAWGLLGPKENDRIWRRHILNSAVISQVIPAFPHRQIVIDIGSGAGLPGIPLAILRPDLQVTLLEPLLRRVKFLELVNDELTAVQEKVIAEIFDAESSANNSRELVTVVRSRAEDYRSQKFDFVTCRAVAALPKLLPWCKHLFLPNGKFVALKGNSAAAEISSVTSLLHREKLSAELIELKASEDSETTWVVAIQKDKISR